jgi:hypothetical protein
VLWGDGVLWGDAAIGGESMQPQPVPEVKNVSLDRPNPATLRVAWDGVAAADSYRVSFGTLGALHSGGTYDHVSSANALNLNGVVITQQGSRVVADLPASSIGGTQLYALVAAVDRGVQGSLGTDSAGQERPAIEVCP